jgi:hypothetical protein
LPSSSRIGVVATSARRQAPLCVITHKDEASYCRYD